MESVWFVSLISLPFLSFRRSIRSVSLQSLRILGILELRNVAIYFKPHMNHDITSLCLQTGRRKHIATAVPPFQMLMRCKSVVISRIGFGLRNPRQSQTLMLYRKFWFHALSADLQSVRQGWCPWRNGAERCPDRPQELHPDSQPNHITLMAPSSAAHSRGGPIPFICILCPSSSFYGGGLFDQYNFCLY